MGKAAIRAAEAAEYENAGTIEFLVDAKGNFYFIEMNTRIQVEHPVTEEVTGIDLIKQQIRIANGEKLEFDQSDITFEKHAIECRINAEDPARNFAPSPGTIGLYYPPGGHGVRVDSHVYSGYTIPPYYDSMIGKLICFGSTRKEALERAYRALSEYLIRGIKTTIPLHKAIMADPLFIEGKATTAYMEDFLTPDHPGAVLLGASGGAAQRTLAPFPKGAGGRGPSPGQPRRRPPGRSPPRRRGCRSGRGGRLAPRRTRGTWRCGLGRRTGCWPGLRPTAFAQAPGRPATEKRTLPESPFNPAFSMLTRTASGSLSKPDTSPKPSRHAESARIPSRTRRRSGSTGGRCRGPLVLDQALDAQPGRLVVAGAEGHPGSSQSTEWPLGSRSRPSPRRGPSAAGRRPTP